MLPNPKEKTKSAVRKQRRRWPHLLTIAFFSICISLFGFAAVAQAADISIDDPTVNEGNGSVTFTVTLSAAGGAVTVDYATGDGTAKKGAADQDYTETSGTLSWPAGNNDDKYITVSINDDSRIELPEDFKVDLSSASGATIVKSTGWCTINDNDKATVTIDDITINENSDAEFTISIDAVAEDDVTFDYATADGTAQDENGDHDYDSKSGSNKVDADKLTKKIKITVQDDSKVELAETFFLNISNLSANAVFGDSQGQCTINVDEQTEISIDDPGVAEGDSGTKTLTFTVTLNNQAEDNVTVQYQSSDNTATAGSDYTATGLQTLTIPAGSGGETFDVTINGDTVVETDETFTVTLSSPSANATITDTTATGTITNDDSYQISVDDVSIAEGDSGTKLATFTVSVDQPGDVPVAVNYATSDDTATAGSDYTATSGTVTILPGAPSATFDVTINGDTIVEMDESFTVTLSNVVGPGTLFDDTGTGTITDDGDTYSISVDDVSIAEGDSGTKLATFTVSLDQAGDVPVTVDYATGGGGDTATAGSDYTAASGTLVFLPASLSAPFDVTINGDTVFEADETFTVTLSNVVGPGTIFDGTGIGTITNDDTYTVTLGPSQTVSEVDGSVTFSVTLDQPAPTGGASVAFSLNPGTAVLTDDYTENTLTPLVIAEGINSGSIVVNITDDTIYELTEDFTVSLSAGTGQVIAGSPATCTINDNDTYTVTLGPSQTVSEADGTVTFSVTLDQPAPVGNASIAFSLNPGTAVLTDDYTENTLTPLVIAEGINSGSIVVNITDDTVYEFTEDFTVSLTAGTGQVIAGSPATCTINDEDKYGVSIEASKTVTEGTDATVTFKVTLDQQVPGGASVDFTLNPNTAVLTDDYTASTVSPLSFGAAETEKDITANIVNDTLYELQENFSVVISSADPNADITADTGVCTINDDDTYTLTLGPSQTVSEADGTVTFSVTLDQPAPAGDASIAFSLNPGTAVLTDDYTENTVSPLVIAEGINSGSIVVNITNDTIVESTEDFTVSLTAGTGQVIAGSPATCTITNDDKYQISISNVSLIENSISDEYATFTVSLDQNLRSGDVVTVEYATADNTAVAVEDYTSKSGTVTFDFGSETETINVVVKADTIVELTESFFVNLTNPSANGALADPQGECTIQDNDKFGITVNNASATEGSAVTFTVTLDEDTGVDIDVTYDAYDWSATAPADYTDSPSFVTFPAGSAKNATQTFTVGTTDDAEAEGNETFRVTVSSIHPNYDGNDDTGTGTINDNDYTLTINKSGSAADADCTVTASAGNPSGRPGGSGSSFPLVFVYQAGDTVTLTATDTWQVSGGSRFWEWTGDLSGNNNPETILMDSNKTVTARFQKTVEITLTNPGTGSGTVTQGRDGVYWDVHLSPGEVATVVVDDHKDYGSYRYFGLVSVDPTCVFDGWSGDGKAISDPVLDWYLSDITGGENVNATFTQTYEISIDDQTVIEGGTAQFTVTVTPAVVANDSVTVYFETADDTTTANSDYTAHASTQLTFSPGDSSKTIDVVTLDDTLVEVQERFLVNLSNASSNATITDSQGQGFIDDDGDTYGISVDDQTVTENGTAQFTVSLDQAVLSGQSVTVFYETADDTAVGGSDYTAHPSTQLTFSALQSTKTIDVVTLDDSLVEVQERFLVNLSNPSLNATILDSQGEGFIDDDTDAYTVSISNVSMSTVQEGTHPDVTFTVSLANVEAYGVVGTVTVDFATVDGTARNGPDYTGGSGTLTFSGLDDSYDITVPIVNDTDVENDETFQFDLSNPVNCSIAGTDPVTVTIQDDGIDDYDVSIDSPAAVVESPSVKVTFTVTLANVDAANGVAGTVNVNYETSDVSAIAGSDYTAIPTTLMTFNNGDPASKTFDVAILEDALVENPETFEVLLTGFDGGGATGGPGTGTINDDGDSYDVSVDSPPAVMEAGGATITFTIALTNVEAYGVVGTVNVNYETSDVSAVGGSDYSKIPTTTMTFNNGDGPSKTFDVTVLQDTLVENAETFKILLSGFDGGGATGAAGTGTINDDGDTYGIFIDDQSAAEGGTATFTVSLDQTVLSGQSVTVDYATADGTAVDTEDYTATTGSLTFGPNQTTETFSVSITDDALVEYAESFFVNLSNGSVNSSILDGQGEGTILIDEKYQISINDIGVGEKDGTATFTVTVSPAIEADDVVTVDWATANGTAVDGEDYTSTGSTLTFNPGDTALPINIPIPILNDALVDPGEVFVANLSNSTSSLITNIADDQGTCTIADNNYYLTISNPASGVGTVDVSTGSISGLGGADDLSLGPGDSVDIVYEDGDVVSLSDEKPAIAPDPGSVFKGFSANPVTMDAHKTVTATFVKLYRLQVLGGANGTISPSTDVILEHGQSQTFTMTSNAPNYTVVEDVLVDGGSVASETTPPLPALNSATYTFTNVTANHTIGAIFTDFGSNCETAASLCCPPDVTAQPAEISPAGEWDYFKVETTTVGMLKVYTSGNTDTFGYLLDTDCDTGTPIDFNDDRDQVNSNFLIKADDLLPGTYYVAVRHWEKDPNNPVGTGPYTLHVEFNTDDHGSDPDSATFVGCNSSIGGNLEAGGNVDYFQVDLAGDGTLTVYSSGTTDTIGTLMDVNEDILSQNNNMSGTDNNFYIQRDVSAGTYYVAVSHNDPLNGTGAYTLNVDCELTYTITATAGFGGAISPEGDILVNAGDNQSFTITPDGTNTIADVQVDGASVGPVSTYNFIGVSANHNIVAIFQLPADICVDISDVPLDARFQAAPANVMFVLDDSGSMDWTIMTPENNGLFRPGGSGGSYRYVFEDNDNLYDQVIPAGTKRLYWKSQWSSYNRMYYNPNVTYEPWPTLSDAHPDHPRSHPMHATPTSDLSDSYWEVDTNDPLAGIEVIVDSEDQADLVLTVDGQPSLEPTIIDNEDPEFSSSGPNWRYRSGSDEAYNGDYYDTNNNGDYTATWTPDLQAGEYEVYARWHASTNNASSVAYTITYTGGATDTIWVNQEKNGGKWVLLGTYDFDGGTSGNVTLTHTRPDGSNRACADAVRFKPTSGMWDWATDAEAYNGHYWWTPTDATYTATWTPNLPATPTDTWEVQARWHASNERSTSVTYTINHQAGSDNVIVDQRQNGGEWVSLGTYKFNPGTSGNVTLSHTRTGSTDTACADAVRFVYATPATIDIKRAHYYTWYDADTDEVIDPGEVYLIIVDGEIKYYEFTQDDGDEVVEPGDRLQAIAAVDAPDAIKTGRTYAQERQNLANWYSFYRRRELTATNAIAKVITNMTGVKIGFYSINGLLNQPVLPVKVGEQDETATLLSTLYNLVLQRNSTPLRRGLRSVGRYFDADDGSSGGIGSSPFASAAGGGECQQAFAVVMTDGYYNGGSPDLGNTDGDNNTAFDGFAPYSDNYWNSLADVAMHYYERDLVAGLDNIVPTHPEDSATHQHMVTYTVSFGVFGTLDPDSYDLLGGSYPTWPNPNQGDQEKIDDLWHAGVNGRGRFLSARDPEELTTQLLIIMQNIEGRVGSSSSVSVNGDELYETLGADIRMFQAQYNSDTWAGDVRSHEVDLTTGEVVTSSYLWSAANELENLHWNTRVIGTFDGVTGRPFRFDDLTDELKGLLDENWEAGDTNARNILNYLRGDSTNERQYAGTFRDRTQKLGDIVHSSPVFADGRLYAGANDGMLHAFDADTGIELFAYIPKLVFANIEELADPLYAHKFYVDLTPEVEDIGVPGDIGVDDDGDTVIDEDGEEKIKKILVGGLGKGGRGYYALDITDPSTIATESDLAGKVMWEYPNPRILTVSSIAQDGGTGEIIITTATAHGLSTGDQVNIANVNSDANGTWTVTYLTDTTFRLDGSVYGAGYSSGGTASAVDSDWADIGYSYSRPAILNSQAGWIVIFGNGYNSASGEAKLIILDAEEGTLVKSIDTQADACNGLSSPTPIDVDFDGKVDYVFAGDLKGNMWKFDLTDTSASNWDVAYKSGGIPKPLFHTVSPEGQDQPITTKADVMDWCTTHGYMVVFGTGKWMGEFDFENTFTQSIYGIWDYGDDSDDSEYLGNFDRGNIPELTNMADTVTLLGQTVLLSTETDPNFWTVNDQKIRILTNNVETVEYPWETSSYLVDGVTCGEGTGTEDCDPNGVPSVDANPDPVNLAGWYFDLPFAGERIVSDALIRQGNAIFVAYTPEQTPCGSGGSSVIMEMDACTGGRTSTPQFDINEDQVIDENDMINIGTAEEPIWVTATGIQSPGRLQPPAILRMPGGDTEMKYFSSSRGQIVTVEEKAVIVGISYWLEFE